MKRTSLTHSIIPMLKEYNIVITEDEEKQRLDYFLSQKEELGLSRSRIQELIREGHIKVDRQAVKAKYLVKAGEEIILSIPDPVPLEVQAEDIPLNVVYEDESLLVINKPAGLVVHPGAGNVKHTLVNALLAHCTNLSGIGGVLRPGIVHRLDKDTSGLLIVAKNDAAHQELTRQLAERKISRQYLAIVGGNFTHTSGTVDLPIGRHPVHRQKMSTDARQSKTAVTHYQVLEQFDNCSLLLVKLDTGRTHQIRVHMAHFKHPVLGDKTYGHWSRISLKDESGRRQEIVVPRQMLHAAKLTFTHPETGQEMRFEAPLPQDMQKILTKLRVGV